MSYGRFGDLSQYSSYTHLLNALQPYASAFAIVAALTLIALFAVPPDKTALLAMADLPVVFAVAAVCGPRAGTLATVTAAAAYDYFCTDPVHSFRISRLADLALVGVLLLLSFITAWLGSMLRSRLSRQVEKASHHAAKSNFSERLLTCTTEMSVTWAVCAELHRVFGCSAIIVSKAETVRVAAGFPSNTRMSPVDCAAAAFAIESGQATGRGNQYIGTADWSFHPIWSADRSVAIGLARHDGKAPVSRSEIPLLFEMLDQAADAFAAFV